MQRFYIDGMKLYYPSEAAAKAAFPGATQICLIEDTEHLEYIHRILRKGKVVAEYTRGSDYRMLLTVETSSGICDVMVTRDVVDGHFYDYARHRLRRFRRAVDPVLWEASTPKDICMRFLAEPARYEVLAYGSKVPKPRDLKGMKPVATAHFCKASCQIYIKGLDLYIKHGDYFSPTYCRSGDIGTPLGYRAAKYGMGERKSKFIYDDNWGSIVQKRNAWIRISNFTPMHCNLNDAQCGKRMCELLCDFHRFSSVETEWQRFFEEVSQKASETLHRVTNKEESNGD